MRRTRPRAGGRDDRLFRLGTGVLRLPRRPPRRRHRVRAVPAVAALDPRSSASTSGARARGTRSPGSSARFPSSGARSTRRSSRCSSRRRSRSASRSSSPSSPRAAADAAGLPDRAPRGDPVDRLRPLGHLRPRARSSGSWRSARPRGCGSCRSSRARRWASACSPAALILAVMVVPFTSSVAREVLKAVPATQREAAYALGRHALGGDPVALRYGADGILGAVILGLGRALGETMAVTMVIGNNPQISCVAVRAPVHDGGRTSPTSSPRRPTTCTCRRWSRSASCSSSSRSSSTSSRGCSSGA